MKSFKSASASASPTSHPDQHHVMGNSFLPQLAGLSQFGSATAGCVIDGMRDNGISGARARIGAVLTAYQLLTGEEDAGALAALLTDIRHYCDKDALDFDHIDQQAHLQHAAEVHFAAEASESIAWASAPSQPERATQEAGPVVT